MEEEEGADEGTQGPGDKAGTKPPQDAAKLQHGIAAGRHHQGRVPSRQLEVLHGRRWSSLTRSAPLSEVHEGRVASRVTLPRLEVPAGISWVPPPCCPTSLCHPSLP